MLRTRHAGHRPGRRAPGSWVARLWASAAAGRQRERGALLQEETARAHACAPNAPLPAADQDRIVLRRVDAAAQHVAVVALQRVWRVRPWLPLSCSASSTARIGVARDRVLQQAAVGRGGCIGRIDFGRGAASSSTRLLRSSASISPTASCTRGRLASEAPSAARRAPVEKADQPVARGTRHRVVERAQQHHHPGLLRGMGVDVGLAAGIGRPLGRRAQVDRMVERNRDLLEDHLVAARGAQAQVVPARHHANAGRVARHQEEAGARRRFVVGAAPDREPVQPLDAGGVELVAVDLPSIAFAPRRGRGQAAARRRTERGLHAQGIDQCALAHRIAQHALAQVRPASGCRCAPIAWCCSQVIVRISAVAGSP